MAALSTMVWFALTPKMPFAFTTTIIATRIATPGHGCTSSVMDSSLSACFFLYFVNPTCNYSSSCINGETRST
jgi:hypothetical protein